MADPAQVFIRRVTALIALLIAAIVACICLAVVAGRDANRTLNQLAGIELEAAQLARQFRGVVDDMHGALLRIGSADDSVTVIEQRRQRLNGWLADRLRAARSDEERQILERLASEVRSYLAKLDNVAARPDGFSTPIDRDTIVMFDDSANRLQSMADDFAAVHDADLRRLLEASLASVHSMRNLVFVCLGLLIVAISVVVALLYRDVVRPLRVKLYQNETLLAQREKLAALGTLAAGVAHEIRNPLTAVKARLYTLRRVVRSGEAADDLKAIAQEIERLERIVRDILDYARPADPTLLPVELTGWLTSLVEFLKPELETAQVKLVVEASTRLSAQIDADKMRQVVLNLVRNAKEAFDGKPGRVTLGLRRERAVLRGKPTELAVLSVTDNGPGIPAALQARLFDPFFTTKAAGTGLGLSIVARLVEQHGGEIAVQSAAQAGTTFAVRLPACDPTSESQR